MSLAYDVARAAMWEIGEPAGGISEHKDDHRAATGLFVASSAPRSAIRAAYLGYMAEHGPNYLVRCSACAPFWGSKKPCTPVRDAIRGLTCTP